MAEASEEDANWTIDLETALIEGCDFGTLRNICQGRPVPDHLRAEVWQICLNVAGKSDPFSAFDELFDLPEQGLLREDCHAVVDKLGNEEEEKLSVASDLESILTYYCKARGMTYQTDNGWLELLQPMMALKLSKSELYNALYAFISKYIPRDCSQTSKAFHLLRLLLLYHDPELCSFLDSRRITPEMYSHSWFRSLFARDCDLKVILKMWDVYLQHADPFLTFFLALVILVNAKEQIICMESASKAEIIEKLCAVPGALEADDIEDFCSLAQYYASRTPQSFRRDFQNPLFGMSLASQKTESEAEELMLQALCLPVSVKELLQANNADKTGDSDLGYFVVDCRPAEQYNAGHLPIAFHLDANLMLQNPQEFSVAVQALFAAQQHVISTGSEAGGEHLCFLGSGREEEDQYVNMVVAHFLQRNSQYISVTRGGYAALHEVLADDLTQGLVDHTPRACIMCSPNAGQLDGYENHEEFESPGIQGDSLIGKLSLAVKSKSAQVKEKMINYIKNEPAGTERHVSSSDKVGKRYRNMASVFTIGDEEEDDVKQATSSDDERREVVNIDTWLNKPSTKYAFQCQEVRETGYVYPSHLLVTEAHVYVLREMADKAGMAWIQARRPLGSIVKITSKKRHPELITFKYGSNDDQRGLVVTDLDRFFIPKAGEATKVIKQQIMRVLETLDT